MKFHAPQSAIIGALIVLGGAGSPVGAQRLPESLESQRIRITTADGRAVAGRLMSFDNDSLIVAAGASNPERIAWRSVLAVDVSRGRSNTKPRNAAIGTAAGTLVGLAAARGCSGNGGTGGWQWCSDMEPFVIGGGAFLGLVIGIASGSSGPERWRPVPFRRDAGVVPAAADTPSRRAASAPCACDGHVVPAR